MKKKKVHMVTVKILVDCDNDIETTYTIHEILQGTENIIDWGYLKIEKHTISDKYKEGDMFEQAEV